MKKIAIFVEGHTEMIFVERLLHHYFRNCIVIPEKFRSQKNIAVRIRNSDSFSYYHYYFLLINVENDEKVTSAIRDSAENMVNQGFVKIIGLRDLFPRNREEKAKVLEKTQEVIAKLSCTKSIHIILAVMETEAWFLADHNFFQEIHSSLTPEYIKASTGFDLEKDDPEITYQRPSTIIERVYKLVDKQYKKREDESHEITKAINFEYLCLDVQELNKIESFFLFLECFNND